MSNQDKEDERRIKRRDTMIFIKYIITRPFIELKELIVGLIGNLTRPKFWFYIIFFVFMFRTLISDARNLLVDRLILLALFLIILWKEYDDGRWKAAWRENEKRKAIEHVKREMEKDEVKKDGI